MSVELIGIISVGVAIAGVGVALAGLILASRRDINLRLISLEQGQADLRERMARQEGILKGNYIQKSHWRWGDNRRATDSKGD